MPGFTTKPLFEPKADGAATTLFVPNTPETDMMQPSADPLLAIKQSLSRPQTLHYIWDLNEHTLTWTSQSVDAHYNSHINEGSWVSLIHPDDRIKFLQIQEDIRASARPFMLHYRLHTSPDSKRMMHVTHSGSISSESGNSNNYITGTIELSAAEGAAATEALTTQFAYPANIMKALNAAIDQSKRSNLPGALLICNINNLSMILSGYGHEITETVISQLLEHIRQSLSPEDFIERLGRDEFVIILASRDKLDPHLISQQIHTRIQHYAFNTVHGALHVICSIGSVDFPTSATTAIDAMDKAYIAQSFTNGITYRAYEESQEDAAVSRQQMGLANYLRKAIQHNRIRMAYQPVVDTKNGEITHYEALLRLISDDGKITSAGALLPIAERMGLIDMVDFLVLEMVIKELEASPNLKLAFNVSNLTTDNTRWLERFHELVGPNPALANRLIVEITETAAHRDLRKTAYFVASLQSLGCQVALDDFGSGYTSFRQLKALSVDMIKIDGTFIKDIIHNADNQFFVRTLLEFTQGFGLKTVAEFVENGEIAKMMMQMGVDYLQGYYFGRPQNNRSWLHQGE